MSKIPKLVKPSGFWTKTRIIEHASKFKYKKDFRKSYPGAYDKAIKLNILDSLVFENLGNVSHRCIYICLFEDNSVYIGLTYNFHKRITEHLCKNSNNRSSIYRYIIINPNIKYNFIQISNYIPVNDAKILEQTTLNYYKNLKFNVLNKIKAGAIGTTVNPKWTFNKIKEAFLNYSSYSEIIKSKDRGAYDTAIKLNILSDIKFKNNTTARYRNVKYTLKDLQLIFSKYTCQKELINSIDKRYYKIAQRLKILNKLKYNKIYEKIKE